MSWVSDAVRSRIEQGRRHIDELEQSIQAKADEVVQRGSVGIHSATRTVARDASAVVQTGTAHAQDLADAAKNAKPLASNAVAQVSARNQATTNAPSAKELSLYTDDALDHAIGAQQKRVSGLTGSEREAAESELHAMENEASRRAERPENAATPDAATPTVRERLAPVGAFLEGTATGLVTGGLGPPGVAIQVGLDAEVARTRPADQRLWYGVGQEVAGAFHIAHGLEMAAGAGIGDAFTLGGATAVAAPVAAVGAMEVAGGLGIMAGGQQLAASGASSTAVAPERARTPRSIAEDHIFKGEVTRRPGGGGVRATGFHHEGEAAAGNARIIDGTKTKPNALGVYEASVEVKDPVTGQWVQKGSQSSFFPKDWDRPQVRAAIREAYANRVEETGGLWHGTASNGMTVEGFTDANGNIITAYPRY